MKNKNYDSFGLTFLFEEKGVGYVCFFFSHEQSHVWIMLFVFARKITGIGNDLFLRTKSTGVGYDIDLL